MTKRDGMLYNTWPVVIIYTGKNPRKAKRVARARKSLRTKVIPRTERIIALQWRLVRD
jgi:hypothetical protein